MLIFGKQVFLINCTDKQRANRTARYRQEIYVESNERARKKYYLKQIEVFCMEA